MSALLIDASGYIYRSYFALPELTNSKDQPTHAVHGFVEMMWALRKRTEMASHIIVCFDKDRSKRRAELYSDYKANRPAPKPEFVAQLEWIREATQAFGYPVVESQGIEADDLLASYAQALVKGGTPVTIVSGDKDLLQCLGEHIKVWCPVKKRHLTANDAMEKFGVPPSRVVDAQALIGDSADNIPGVPRIGKVKAGELIGQFGSLANLLANTHLIKKDSIRHLIEDNMRLARLSYDLAKLDRETPLPVPIDDLCTKPIDPKTLLAFTQRMEFASLTAEIARYYGVAAHERCL